MQETTHATVGAHLVGRLQDLGVKHVFGVPGDFVLGLMDVFVRSPDVSLIVTCNELNAGYAADAYARIRGVGVACVTYNVGALSLLNAVMGAAAERVPLIVISGAPARDVRSKPIIMHHTNGDLGAQRDIFARCCAAVEVLDNPDQVQSQIDHAISSCLRESLPVYLEVPMDMVDEPLAVSTEPKDTAAPLDDRYAEISRDAALATVELMRRQRSPAWLVGHEVSRFGLVENLMSAVAISGMPYAVTLAAKGLIPEDVPGFMGVYAGSLFCTCARSRIEQAEGIIRVGARLSDVDLIGTSHSDLPGVHATEQSVMVGRALYNPIDLRTYLSEMASQLEKAPLQPPAPVQPCPYHERCPWTRSAVAETDAKGSNLSDDALSIVNVFEQISRFVDENHLIVADTGDALFSAAEIPVRQPGAFVAQALYLSIGYSVPATLGAALARPDSRVLTLVGDGAFQMTCQELSTIQRHELNPIVLLLNNGGYATERAIHEGPFNDIQPWRYTTMPAAFGGKHAAFVVRTRRELATALVAAQERPEIMAFIEVVLPSDDVSRAIRRLGMNLR